MLFSVMSVTTKDVITRVISHCTLTIGLIKQSEEFSSQSVFLEVLKVPFYPRHRRNVEHLDMNVI